MYYILYHTRSAEPAARASSPGRGAGRELLLSLRRGAAGFGFTIADSVHGQKVKKVTTVTMYWDCLYIILCIQTLQLHKNRK